MKVAILKINGKPYGICEVRDFNSLDVAKVQKEIEQNVVDREERIGNLEKLVDELKLKLAEMNDQIKILKGEE